MRENSDLIYNCYWLGYKYCCNDCVFIKKPWFYFFCGAYLDVYCQTGAFSASCPIGQGLIILSSVVRIAKLRLLEGQQMSPPIVANLT